MSRVDKTFTRMRDTYRSHGQGMRDMGRSMSLYVTAPLTALGVLATNTAVSFESAFAGIRKTVRASAPELQEINKQLQEMTKTTPQAYEELAGLARVAGQLGVEKENITSFTKTIADLSVTTLDFKGEEAAQTMARFANIVQMSQSDFDRLGSTISLLGDQTATSEARIANMALRIAAAGKQIGLSEAEILGFSASLSSLGMEAQAGGTAMSRIMMQMLKDVQKNGKELKIWAQVSGMSVNEFKQAYAKDALSTIQQFISGVTDMGEKSVLVFDALKLGGIRTSDALRRLAGSGNLVADTMKKGSREWEENMYLTETAGKVYETSASQFKMFWNELRLFAKEMGEIILPVVRRLVDHLRSFLRIVSAMPKNLKVAVVIFTALAAALGPMILMLGVMNGLLASMGIILAPVLGTLVAIGAALGVIVVSLMAIKKAWENLQEGNLMGATTYGLVAQAVGSRINRGGPGELRQGVDLSNISLAGMARSATEIVLRVVGDKATAVESVDKKKGDANLNVITQGYLGLAEAQ